MAIENITVVDGESTADVATDVVGTDHFQVVKIALGADGALDNIVDAGAQTSAASIPVVLASDHADIKITLDSEAVAVTNAGITTIAGAVAGTEMQVDVLTMPSTTVTATNLDIRDLTNTDVVTAELSATDNAVLDTIDAALDAINAKLVTGTVIGDVNLGATDNAVLDAIAASVTALDNSVDGNYLNVNLNVAGTDVAANAGTLSAQTLRVTIATDDEVNNLLGTIDADTSSLVGCVGGTELQVDIVGSLPAGTAAIGKLAANSGVDIGDVDVASVIPGVGATNLGKAEDAAHSGGDTGVMALGVRTDTLASLSGATNDYEPLKFNKLGALWVNEQAATPHKNIDVDESEDAVSAAPCILKGFYAYANVAAGTKRYLKLYNDTVANVTVGTTVPDMTFELDGTQGLIWSTPLLWSAALTVAATTGVADNDTGAPGANEVIFNCGYIAL